MFGRGVIPALHESQSLSVGAAFDGFSASTHGGAAQKGFRDPQVALGLMTMYLGHDPRN